MSEQLKIPFLDFPSAKIFMETINIPFLDMTKEAKILIENGLDVDIKNTLLSGKYLFGTNMESVEAFFSQYFNSYAILVGSGTDALYLSLKALGIKPGDKVIIPAYSAIPTAIAVKMLYAIPIYVDIDDTATIDIPELKKKLNDNIKAVIPVHLYGNTAFMEKIIPLCNERNIPIIEDCAQSLGSKINSKPTGTFGDLGAFSFYPSKNVGIFSDGGMVVTKNLKLANLIKELRFYGQTSKYKMGDNIGINSRMDEIQCTILLKKIQLMEQTFKRRIEIKQIYDRRIEQLNGIILPCWQKEAVPHLYPILSRNRTNIMEKLKQKGIETVIHYPFCLPDEIEKTHDSACTKAEEFSQNVFSIPFHPYLENYEVEYIINNIEEICKWKS